MRVWINGEARSSPADAASGPTGATRHHLTLGEGVMEAVKVVDGQSFALGRHFQRLAAGAREIGLPEIDEATLRRAVAEELAGRDLPLGRLRITYTAGRVPGGDDAATLAVVADTMGEWPASTAVATVPWPRNERGAIAGLKATAYADNLVALAAARRAGATEAIFANLAGHLCEGTGTNVFYVVDGELRTPSPASGCLPGVTRALVLEWYGGREVDEPLEVIERASEVFLVSTTRDVQAVHRWDDRELPAPGPVTTAVQEVWRRREPELLGF